MTLSAVADRDERGIAPWGPIVDKNIPTERDGRPCARQGWGVGCLPCTPAPCSGPSRSSHPALIWQSSESTGP